MGKGEIARYEQFLLFPQCFKRLVSQGRQKASLCGNGLKGIVYFDTQKKKVWEKIMEEENDGNLLYNNCVLQRMILFTLYNIILTFNYPKEESLGKYCGK